MVAGRFPSDRQGHPDHPYRLLEHDAEGARLGAAQGGVCPWLVDGERREDVEEPRERGRPECHGRGIRDRRVSLLFASRGPLRSGRRLLERGLHRTH